MMPIFIRHETPQGAFSCTETACGSKEATLVLKRLYAQRRRALASLNENAGPSAVIGEVRYLPDGRWTWWLDVEACDAVAGVTS